ncbi:beta-1,4-galactosyltransferase 2 [Lingula anatina]|uniref:Beta-1,4-galactosyltransferase n=1 Tax=Lingula anatina TaxID=7574 RepID=A0A2R2MKY8_LINAN|nr:beta-1,4-galactosyltransferase 2 [Lingula anatina]|eukprot:XP_023930874.1 beta-1,4-galactosyltransferase 2 [Lingula anatina]
MSIPYRGHDSGRVALPPQNGTITSSFATLKFASSATASPTEKNAKNANSRTFTIKNGTFASEGTAKIPTSTATTRNPTSTPSVRSLAHRLYTAVYLPYEASPRLDRRCEAIPAGLVSRRKLNLKPLSWEGLENKFRCLGVIAGGRWKPLDCVPQTHVAVIIPFRDREEHLRIFLNNMHPMLQKQKLHYGIYVVDQHVRTLFNRAMLMNIGFVEAGKIEDYDCFIFHDVDLLAENELNMYTCTEKPTHMSVAIDKYNYRPVYPNQFGGVTSLTKKHMRLVNGFPNVYFGWGAEDDDMSFRVRRKGAPGLRFIARDIGRYTMMNHTSNQKSNPRYSLSVKLYISAFKRFATDGLNNVNGSYTVLKLEQLPLYTRIYVDVDEKRILMNKQLSKFQDHKWLRSVLTTNMTFVNATSSRSSSYQ